ncbi:hypothetical protein [Vibrio astriarenae]|uniref:hypothetical protein n=1 Tax=Vibrio astriarenae TaxID=1481923 RepID=UPI003734D27D
MPNEIEARVGRTERDFFEGLAACNADMEGISSIVGLGELETKWMMFAYFTPEDEAKSLGFVTEYLRAQVRRKLGVKADLIPSLVRIGMEERLLGKRMNQRLRAAIIGVSQASYCRHKLRYDPAIDLTHKTLINWESKARQLIALYHRSAKTY